MLWQASNLETNSSERMCRPCVNKIKYILTFPTYPTCIWLHSIKKQELPRLNRFALISSFLVRTIYRCLLKQNNCPPKWKTKAKLFKISSTKQLFSHGGEKTGHIPLPSTVVSQAKGGHHRHRPSFECWSANGTGPRCPSNELLGERWCEAGHDGSNDTSHAGRLKYGIYWSQDGIREDY